MTKKRNLKWGEIIVEAVELQGDELVSCTLTEEEETETITPSEGIYDFVAWGKEKVYFPLQYNVEQGLTIGSVPRNPPKDIRADK